MVKSSDAVMKTLRSVGCHAPAVKVAMWPLCGLPATRIHHERSCVVGPRGPMRSALTATHLVLFMSRRYMSPRTVSALMRASHATQGPPAPVRQRAIVAARARRPTARRRRHVHLLALAIKDLGLRRGWHDQVPVARQRPVDIDDLCREERSHRRRPVPPRHAGHGSCARPALLGPQPYAVAPARRGRPKRAQGRVHASKVPHLDGVVERAREHACP